MARPVSVPHLIALASGLDCTGPLSCYYCGAPCDGTHTTEQWVKVSFTGRGGAAAPGSLAVCVGCTIALDQKTTITLLCGEVREGQKSQLYSRVVTIDRILGATKAHLAQLRELCFNPPPPPFAIVLADSGQKHLLYRGRVNHGREAITVSLEEELVTFRPDDLYARLKLIGPLVAATGKPALKDPINPRMGMAVMERYPERGEALLTTWEKVREEPLSRLAAWLSPNKEDCDGKYPASNRLSGVPPKTSGPGRPREGAGRERERGDATTGRQSSLFAR